MSIMPPIFVRCPVCGYTNNRGAIFCNSCGTRLIHLLKPQPVQPPPIPVVPVVASPVAYIPPVYPVYAYAPPVVYYY